MLFDATRMAPVDRLVRVGTGRDAKDVAFCTIFGPVSMTAKILSVREYQSRNAPLVQTPVATGELVGIEKPVAIQSKDEAEDGTRISAHTLEVAD